MAARNKKIRHDEDTRKKIQAAQLINRLMSCVEGEIELSSVQVKAATTLLNKVLPDLQSVDMSVMGEIKQTISAEPLSPEQWEKEYGSHAEH